MKKILFCLTALAAVFSAGAVYAGDDRPIQVEQLPAAARQFIGQHFADAKVSYAAEDRDWPGSTFKVVFADGAKVEFGKDGKWSEVDCKPSAVPEAVVPQQIVSYVGQHHPGLTIVKVERGRKGYEAELQNGIELKFDKHFRVVGIDD